MFLEGDVTWQACGGLTFDSEVGYAVGVRFGFVDLTKTWICVGFFSPTRLAFGVLTIRIENRIVYPGGGGSPAGRAWFPR